MTPDKTIAQRVARLLEAGCELEGVALYLDVSYRLVMVCGQIVGREDGSDSNRQMCPNAELSLIGSFTSWLVERGWWVLPPNAKCEYTVTTPWRMSYNADNLLFALIAAAEHEMGNGGAP